MNHKKKIGILLRKIKIKFKLTALLSRYLLSMSSEDRAPVGTDPSTEDGRAALSKHGRGLAGYNQRLAPGSLFSLLDQLRDKSQGTKTAMQKSSLVHTLETTGKDIEAPLYRDVMRKHCRLEFVATQELYQHFDNTEGRDRVGALLMCRTRAWFVRNRIDGSVRVASNSCRLRWCPLCARARANYIRHAVSEWFETADHPKLLTMTIQHSQDSLANQINKIYQAFRSFRKDKFFKMYCTGGVWFFQLCWNPKRHEWHPHIHCIVTGSFMDYKELRRIWLRCTGDSNVLDIRAVRDPGKVVGDVARYASRPCQLSNLPNRQGIEAMMSLYGRRIAGSWGSARGISFRPKKIPDPENWEYLGRWTIIHDLARTDERAKSILKAYYCDLELGDGYSCYDIEAAIEGIDICDPDAVEIDPKPPPTLYD